jgi:hypothetical protein
MNRHDKEPPSGDPRLILLGSLAALLAGVGAVVVMALLAQRVL